MRSSVSKSAERGAKRQQNSTIGFKKAPQAYTHQYVGLVSPSTRLSNTISGKPTDPRDLLFPQPASSRCSYRICSRQSPAWSETRSPRECLFCDAVPNPDTRLPADTAARRREDSHSTCLPTDLLPPDNYRVCRSDRSTGEPPHRMLS